MLSMIQVFQPPTVNLRLVIGLCTLIEYGPEVFRVCNQLGDGRFATDQFGDCRTQVRVSQPWFFGQPGQTDRQCG